MPEGPEIRREAVRLAKVLVDQPLERVWCRFPGVNKRARSLKSAGVSSVRSWGKALLTGFSDGRTIYSHNQLYGVWYVVPQGTEPETGRDLRLALETSTHRALLYSASEIDLLGAGELMSHPFLAKLGPDVFDDGTTPALLRKRMRSRPFARRPVGRLLMDQHFLAGLGNYLRTEILFAARIHPHRRPMDLADSELGELARQIRRMAFRAYETKGETATRAFVSARKRQGLPRRACRHWVFEREEEPCPVCGTKIRRETVDGRRLYLCPNCQRVPLAEAA
ncbi:MAG: endonuclease VIII [Pseudomonadota bacterium]|nr:endonuclease VIII [Pseudomonadota bacterium]